MEYGELMEENAKLKHYLRTTGKLDLMLGLMDELNKLKEENARLREALELIRDICGFDACDIAHKALERGE